MTIVEGPGWRLRLGTPSDNQALCTLARDIPMGGRLVVAQERDPDYFAALCMHDGPHVAHVVESTGPGGGVVGSASYALRRTADPDGPKWVGHVGDIRLHAPHRNGQVFPRIARVGLEAARERHGAELFFTAILDDNQRARRAVRPAHHRDLPVIRPVMSYRMLAIQCATGRHRVRGDVRRAEPGDLDLLVRFLQEREGARRLGQRIDRGLFAHRFATWDGLEPSSFLLAYDRSGALVGCTAPWDAEPVRRVRVHAYRGPLRAYRHLHGMLARRRRATPLPPAGGLLRYQYLTHLEATDDAPEVYADLVAAAWNEARPQGYHFVAAMEPQGIQVLPRRPSWQVDRTDITLHAVTLPDSEWTKVPLEGRVGFEMALA